MILHRETRFRKVDEKVVYLDEELVGGRTGVSRKTKNISLIVALESVAPQPGNLDRDSSAKGCLVATCHLFWHPQYTYERAR